MPQIAGFRGQLPDADRDPTRAMYRYHQVYDFGGRQEVRKALFAAIKLVPWTEGNVRPHEATVEADRDAELARIRASKVHAAPVFCGYRDAATEVDRQFKKLDAERPVYESESGGVKHRLWRVQSAEVIGDLRKLFAPKKLHVLEGHARYEAMLAYSGELDPDAALPMHASSNYGLACLVNLDDPTLHLVAQHRVLRGAAERDTVLASAKQHFIVEKVAGAAKDEKKLKAALASVSVAHQPMFVVVFAGDADAWKLTMSPDVNPVGEGVQVHRALMKYEPIVVDAIWSRHVPGTQPSRETDMHAALAQLEAGASAVVLMRPLTIEQMVHTNELGQVLPAGSTSFYPLPAPLVTYLVNPDEDVV